MVRGVAIYNNLLFQFKSTKLVGLTLLPGLITHLLGCYLELCQSKTGYQISLIV